MKIDRLKYSKGEPSKKLTGRSAEPSSNFHEAEGSPNYVVERTDYTKGTPFRSTRIIFILSGGSKREKDYFRPLRTDRQIHSVKIAFRSKKDQGLKPYELKSLATEFISNGIFVTEDNTSYHIEEGDLIYLLQDVDEFSEEIKSHLKDKSQISSYRWIISNPSFETWLFYHYYDDPSPLWKGLEVGSKDRSNWLKEYLHTLIPGGISTTQAFYSVEKAIANSKKNYSGDDDFPLVYSTQMHLVAESILQNMDEEFAQMKRRREEREEYFRCLNNRKCYQSLR